MVQRGQQKGWDVVGSVQAWQGVTTRHVQWRRAQVGDDAQTRERIVSQDRSAQVFQRSGGGGGGKDVARMRRDGNC